MAQKQVQDREGDYMTPAFRLFIRKKAADILRGKVTSGDISEALADKVRVELFSFIDEIGDEKIVPILLSSIIDSEVEAFGK